MMNATHSPLQFTTVKGEESKRVGSGGGHFRPTSDELGLRVHSVELREMAERARSPRARFWAQKKRGREERPMDTFSVSADE